MSGSFLVKNKYLEELLESKGKNTKDVWKTIISDRGSVVSLDFLSAQEKIYLKPPSKLTNRGLWTWLANVKNIFVKRNR